MPDRHATALHAADSAKSQCAKPRASTRPRLRRIRRASIAIAVVALSLWLLSLISGYELMWARGHEAIVFSGGKLVYYRSSSEYLYCLQRTPLNASRDTRTGGLTGDAVTQLSVARPSDAERRPALYPTGFAINAVASVPLSPGFFEWRRDLWRYTLPLWMLAPIAVVPWRVGAVWFRLRLAIARRRLKKRHRPDRCGTCGYLRAGLRPGTRCPECGAPPSPHPAPQASILPTS